MAQSSRPVRQLGRYALYGQIASGGMATVHFGRMLGVVGFSKTVAIKRLHPHLARDPEFVSMFLDEARLAARIRHPNVVSTLDVVALEGELFLVMEYVQGESVGRLMWMARHQSEQLPPGVVATIMVGALHGLHAAHDAKSERGEPLNLVHRDISPQNILVGVDGVPRVLDFGVAKASGRLQTTRDGQVKGKFAYMSPEQLMGTVDRSTDVFAASVVLWEALTGKRLFASDNPGETVALVLNSEPDPPSMYARDVPPELDALILRGLAKKAVDRFSTAREMARALEKSVPLAPASDVGELVERLAGTVLAQRSESIARIESSDVSELPASASNDPSDPAASPIDAAAPFAAKAESSSSAADDAPTGRRSLPGEAGVEAPRSVVSDLPPTMTSTVSTAIARLRGNQRIVGVTVAGAVALLLLAIGVHLGSQRGQDDTGSDRRPLPPTAAASAQPPSPAAPDVPSTTPLAAVPSAAAAPAPPEDSSISPPDTSSASPAPAASPSRAGVGTRRPHGSCDPPYTIDSAGIRKYKKECE